MATMVPLIDALMTDIRFRHYANASVSTGRRFLHVSSRQNFCGSFLSVPIGTLFTFRNGIEHRPPISSPDKQYPTGSVKAAFLLLWRRTNGMEIMT
jgi:hypothetical protein